MRDTSSSFAQFLARSALVLVCGIAAVTALVVVVDPYGLYRLVGPFRFNAVKPALTRYQEQIKQVRVLQVRPDIVILGNSRAEIGFDPKAPALLATGEKVYSLGIAGTDTDTTARQLRQLKADGIRPKTLIIGLEFLDFVQPADMQAPAAPVEPVAAAIPGSPAGPAFWKFDVLFSLASVKDAIETLRIQHDGEAATMDLDGFNPLMEYGGHVRKEGYAKIFAQRASENARFFHRKSTTSLSPANWRRLQSILDTTLSMDADIKFVIYPYHAQIQAMYQDAGLWPLFEQWKHALVATIAQARRDHPGARLAVYDFSGFGPYNCEHIPEAGETGAVTNWYWEGGHFKKALGDKVLARLMSGQEPQGVLFGFELTQATEAANSARIAAEQKTCALAAPATFASAQQLMKNAALAH